jgi:drug/metabolite transporter (DMT)-like permease
MALAIYFCIIAASVTQSATAKLYNGKNTDPDVFCFNALKAASAVVLFVFAALFGGFDFHIPTVVYGLFYGLSLCLSMYAGYRALCLGPMALTSMLVSFSLIIPLAWGVLFGDERVGVLQWVAFGCLLVSMVVMNADKLKANTGRESKHALWLVFVALTFLSNGVCSILQKEHQRAFRGSLAANSCCSPC